MTRRDQLVEELFSEWEQLDETGKMQVFQYIKQNRRATAFGLSVELDESSGFFFISDTATTVLVALPPMNLSSVTAWLDDYEKSHQKNDIAR